MVDALHLYADMKNKKRGVKQHMRARHECTHLQHYAQKQCEWLLPNRPLYKLVVSLPTDLCGCSITSVSLKQSELEACSRLYEDFTLDTDITIDEVATAVRSLRSGGADNLDPEHLKYGGYTLHAWLMRIFTAILCLGVRVVTHLMIQTATGGSQSRVSDGE